MRREAPRLGGGKRGEALHPWRLQRQRYASPESAPSGSEGWAQIPTAKPARPRGVSERSTRAPAGGLTGTAGRRSRKADPGGGRGPAPQPARPLQRVPGERPGPLPPPGPATLAAGTPWGPARTPPDPGPHRERAQGGRGRGGRPPGGRPGCPVRPTREGPGRPSPAAPGGAGRGQERAGRRSVLTGTDILAAAPGARAGNGAGRRGARSAALGAPARSGALGAPARSGTGSRRSRGSCALPARGPGALGAARSRGSCALPAAGQSVRPSPRRACAARRPLPLGAPPPAAALRRTPHPGFLSAHRGAGAGSPPFTHPSGTTSRRTISWLPAGSGSPERPPHPQLHFA